MLAAFDIDGYSQIGNPIELDDTDADFRDYSGIAYSDKTDSLFIIDNRNNLPNHPGNHIIKYTNDGLSPSFINLVDFIDTESIIHLGGDKFALVEERNQDGPDDDQVFDITTFSITDESDIVKGNETTITLNHPPDLQDGTSPNENNKGLEGLAYDSQDKFFYVAKEKEEVRIYRVPELGGTVELVTIPGVTFPNDGLLGDISDIHFVRTPDAPYGRLILLSDESEKIIMADVDSDGTTWHVVVDGNNNPIEKSLPSDDFEGIGFTPGGFLMWVVLDGEDNTMLRYRNFTSLIPDAAPDLDAASDTGVDNNNITQDDTPTFSGTLTRGIFEDSVPVKDAWVWLYADDGSGPVKTGSPDQVDANGDYTVTAAPLGNGVYDFTIRASETNTFDEDTFSFDSPALSVQIFYEDLTDNGYVDFEDLTVLLANWNKPFQTVADGNLVQPDTTTINFNDLTMLLTAWTGPGPGGSPEPSDVWPVDGTTVDEAAIEIFVDFGEAVSGVGASDMVLSGSGGSAASVAAPSKVRTGVWKFPVSGLLPGTVVVDVARDAGDITKVAGGDVDPKHWSFTADTGLTLNMDGTGDVALTDNFLGLSSSAVTVEVTFVSDEITAGIGAGTPIFAYATDDEQDAFTLFIEKDAPNNMKLYVNDVTKTLASVTRNAAYALAA